MVFHHKVISVCAILLFFSFSSVEAKINPLQGLITIKVVDKNNLIVFETKGQVIDNSGLIISDLIVIKKWLDDIRSNLVVIDRLGRTYSIDRLIATNNKARFAVFSIETNGILLTEKPTLAGFQQHKDFINRSIEIFKKTRLKTNVQKTEYFGKDTTSLPAPSKTTPKQTDRLEQYKEQGLSLLLSKRYNEAEDIYLKVLNQRHADLDALKSLALINTFQGRFEEAIKYYNRVLYHEESAETLKRLSNLYLISGQYKMAERTIKRALSLSPFDAQIHYHLAILNILSGDNEQAYNQYINLNKLDKNRAEELFDILYR